MLSVLWLGTHVCGVLRLTAGPGKFTEVIQCFIDFADFNTPFPSTAITVTQQQQIIKILGFRKPFSSAMTKRLFAVAMSLHVMLD